MNQIEEIKGRIKIEELIGESLTVVGRGAVRTTQEHDSLKIWTKTGTWHQYSTGQGGDIFDWWQRVQRCDFRTALEELARKAGVELRPLSSEERQAVEQQRTERRTREEIWALAASYYGEVMWSPAGEEGRNYCASRGWTEETIRREQIGYCPDPSAALRQAQGAEGWGDKKALSVRLREAGLLEHPVAKAVLSIPGNHIVYVHRDERERVVYLSARSVEGKRHSNLLENLEGEEVR